MRSIRTFLANLLLCTFSIGIISAFFPLGYDPLSGGSVFVTSRTTKEAKLSEYTKEFIHADHSSLRLTLRGLSTTESMLDFRLGGHPLISYRNTKEVAHDAYGASSRQANQIAWAPIWFFKKDSSPMIVRRESLGYMWNDPTLISFLRIYPRFNPYISSARGPPAVFLTSV